MIKPGETNTENPHGPTVIETVAIVEETHPRHPVLHALGTLPDAEWVRILQAVKRETMGDDQGAFDLALDAELARLTPVTVRHHGDGA